MEKSEQCGENRGGGGDQGADCRFVTQKSPAVAGLGGLLEPVVSFEQLEAPLEDIDHAHIQFGGGHLVLFVQLGRYGKVEGDQGSSGGALGIVVACKGSRGEPGQRVALCGLAGWYLRF